jgi:hypothetical protein
MENKVYRLAGKEYTPKVKYSLKDWGKIIGLLQGFDAADPISGVVVLLAGDNLISMLNLILLSEVKDELFEEDFEEVGKIISDFFSRKKSLINTGKSSLKN